MKIILTLVLALGFTPAFAQTVDTITKVKGEPIQEKFPNMDKTHENAPFWPAQKGPLCQLKVTTFAKAK